MKRPIATHFLFAGLIASALPAAAQEKKERSVQTTAYQTSVSQEQLRATTRRLKGEMAGLLEEFSRYQAASGELKKLTEALGELDVVTEQDMVAVVKILREASRIETLDESKAKLVEASSGQKEIQALLRAVADRLTLQKEEAEMQKRLDNLALRQMANLRDTKRLAETGDKPEKVKHELLQVREMSKSEQEAIKKEIAMTMDALKNLAEKSESPDKEAFEKALKDGEQNLIRNQAEQAAESVKTDFAEAVKQQEELLKNIKQMTENLQQRKSAEEQSRELAEKMDQLADKQEQLAKKLTEGWGNENKQAVRKEQEKLTDQMELAEESLQKLNPDAASKVEQAKQESSEVAEKIRDKQAMENIDNVAKATDSQKAVAEKLEQAGEMLQQQADALAGNEAQQQQGQDSQQSSEEMSQQQEAISNAVDQIMEAKNQMELAKRQLRDGSDQADARKRLDSAQQMLDQAQQDVAKAGESVEKFVQEELKKADEGIAKTEEGIGVGSKQDQEKSRWNLDRAEGNANLALTGLQRAANRLAAKQGQQQGEQQQANQQNKGDSSRQDTNGPAGPMGRQKEETSGVSAVSKGGGGQREALSLLQQEKAPTEYEAMVQQYIRNLAEAANQE
ncbi:hypothetical protein OVA24_05300 [Luteolibacter sp. SL250]|uniref:hypothetical protein n=1 Tax=Luteolibacter sp. SL250 TaxID=2995170 RepID=UPI002270B557|nr:hypothetical protein [Luteolibacter sp. SL250]WAC20797.1 hypothetical protein OVA24_05300 [Luteolibacter sp. SL250]